jgi:hypothetical protein
MIKRLKSELIASIKNKKINVFFLFLVSAFIILIFTKLSKQHTNTLAFNIEKINVPQDHVIINDSSTVLSLTLKTSGFKWLKYYLNKPKVKIDFSKDVYEKESVYVWSKSKAFLNNTQFDKQVELLNMSPDTLVFRYGVSMVKKVPVVLNSKIEFSQGYDVLEDYIIQPDSIQIIGPDLIVSEIENIETDTIVLSNIKTDIFETVNLKLPKNKKELKFSNTNIVLEALVEKFTEGTLKIPITVINVPKGLSLNFFPKAINVSYYVNLSNFNSVKSKDFKVVCDFNKIGDNQSFLIPELVKFPKSIKKSKINQQRVEFIITE